MALSASNFDRVSFVNTRGRSGLHIVYVHESDILCDRVFGPEMRVSDDSGILFENKAKRTEFY
jgi:hypothetical protein